MKQTIITFTMIMMMSVICLAEEPLKFVGVVDMYPFAYEINGTAKGYDCDIFMEVMKRAGIPVEIELLPFNRCWAYLKEGAVDGIFMIYFKEDRKEFITYCDTPVHVATFHLFVKKGEEFPFNALSDLYGKRVGNQLGFSVTPEFAQAVQQGKIIKDDALSLEMNLKKLMAGRVDCYISSIRLLRPILEKMNLSNSITALPTPILPERKVLMAVSNKSKKIKDIDAFIQTFSTIRNQLDQDGTIARFDENYFLNAGKQ